MNEITYGSKATAETIRQLLEHSFTQIGQSNRRPTPICIWGKHGIGKTELVREWAEEKKCRFVYVAPAQFEEMGDLVGMPTLQQTPEGQNFTLLQSRPETVWSQKKKPTTTSAATTTPSFSFNMEGLVNSLMNPLAAKK